MPAKKPDARTPKTTNVKVADKLKVMIDDVAEALRQPQWQVLGDLLASSLPAKWNAVQPILRKLRKTEAEVEPLRENFRRADAD